MQLRQRIRVSVSRPDGGKEAVLKTARTTLRSRLLGLWGTGIRCWCSRRSARMWMLWRSMSPGIRGRTDNGKEKEMDKLEGLRAGLAEMRSVARRLNQWADDLEQAFQNSDAPRNEVNAGKPVPAEKKQKSAAGKFAADSVVPEGNSVSRNGAYGASARSGTC